MRTSFLLVLTLVLGSACSAPLPGLVQGRDLDRARPVLVLVVPDAELEGGTSVDGSGSLVAATIRQAFAAQGLEAITGTSRNLSAGLMEARELGCGTVVRGRITDWYDTHRDWIASPDRFGLELLLVSVDSEDPVGYGEEKVELSTLEAARRSPFHLAPKLAQKLVEAILTGSLSASDLPED